MIHKCSEKLKTVGYGIFFHFAVGSQLTQALPYLPLS